MTESSKLRADLTPAEREKAERIGRIDFQSAGATRKRDGAPVPYSPEGSMQRLLPRTAPAAALVAARPSASTRC
jgi:hypothetical protein